MEESIRTMLITVLREKFRYNSKAGMIDECMDRFGLTFINFTKILHNSDSFPSSISEEDKKKMFDLANWKLVDKQLVNEQINLKIPVSSP